MPIRRSLACGLATHSGKAILTTDVQEEPLWEPWCWLAERISSAPGDSFSNHIPLSSPGLSSVRARSEHNRGGRDKPGHDPGEIAASSI